MAHDRMTHAIDDPHHPARNGGETRDEVLVKHHANMVTHHSERHPDHAYLFCKHGSYAGANGVLALMFCRFCIQEAEDG